MEGKPGLSWGTYEEEYIRGIDGSMVKVSDSCRVNLMRSSVGWIAIYYDDHDSRGEIIKVFKPRDTAAYHKMMEVLAMWNYGTCSLCPLVKMALDG